MDGFIMENPIKMDDLGVPLFLEPPMIFFGNTNKNPLSAPLRHYHLRLLMPFWGFRLEVTETFSPRVWYVRKPGEKQVHQLGWIFNYSSPPTSFFWIDKVSLNQPPISSTQHFFTNKTCLEKLKSWSAASLSFFYLRLQIDVPWWWHVMTRRSTTQIPALDFWWRNLSDTEQASKIAIQPAFKKTRFHHEFKLNLHEFFCCQFCLVRSSNPKSNPKKNVHPKNLFIFFLVGKRSSFPSKNHLLTPGGLPRRCASWARGDVSPWRLNPSKALRLGFCFFLGAAGHLGNIWYVI